MRPEGPRDVWDVPWKGEPTPSLGERIGGWIGMVAAILYLGFIAVVWAAVVIGLLALGWGGLG